MRFPLRLPLMKRMGKEKSLPRIHCLFTIQSRRLNIWQRGWNGSAGGKLMDEKDQTDICQSDICQTDICRAEKSILTVCSGLQDPGAQCEYLLMLGMEKPLLDSCVDRYRIGGCRTAIWLRQRDRDGMVHFTVTVIRCWYGACFPFWKNCTRQERSGNHKVPSHEISWIIYLTM